MDSFRLHFSDDGIGVAQIMEYDAESIALMFAHAEAGRRKAQLWKGNICLCEVGEIALSPYATPLADTNFQTRGD